MILNQFIASPTCRDRMVCPACRRPGPAGRAFRDSLAQVYTLPAPAVAGGVFPCPHGVMSEAEQREAELLPEGWNPGDFAKDSGGGEPCAC